MWDIRPRGHRERFQCVPTDSPQQQGQLKNRQNLNKATKLAQHVRALAAKMSSIPRPHMVERTDLHRLSPCLCRYAMCGTHTRVTHYNFHSLWQCQHQVSTCRGRGPVMGTCETSTRIQRTVNIAGGQQKLAAVCGVGVEASVQGPGEQV